jgi:ribulose 1,5-bisphosphate synthetase/thiazole synthase
MDTAVGERFVVEHIVQSFPGLRTRCMGSLRTVGAPRMEALFRIMLMSSKRVGALILEAE